MCLPPLLNSFQNEHLYCEKKNHILVIFLDEIFSLMRQISIRYSKIRNIYRNIYMRYITVFVRFIKRWRNLLLERRFYMFKMLLERYIKMSFLHRLVTGGEKFIP